MKKKIYSFLFFSFFLLLLLYLLLFPNQAFRAACNGVNLWFHTILPSLLPFCIISNLLITSELIPKILKPFAKIFHFLFGLSVYGSYALLLGLLCGYPMGAKITSDLYQKGKISKAEGNYLLTFTNHASPVFITSYLSIQLFGTTQSLARTFFLLYASAWMTSIFFRIQFRRMHRRQDYAAEDMVILSAKTSPDRIAVLDQAIFQGFETITKLGGYIILFSIFSDLLQQLCTPFPTLQWLLPSVAELTTGIHQIANSNLPMSTKYIAILTCTSFGGISTIAQTKGMLNSTPLKISTYILGKIVHASCTFLLTALIQII